MSESKVTTFFYGSYMNLNVLKEVDLVPESVKVARLPGFDISIRPLANLIRSDQHCVYGILASATHRELDRLYSHARDVLGGVYLPHPVVAHGLEGDLIPALCYIAPSMEPRRASNDYWTLSSRISSTNFNRYRRSTAHPMDACFWLSKTARSSVVVGCDDSRAQTVR